MQSPSALAVGTDGTIYIADRVAQGEIWTVDPYAGEITQIADLPFPSALALSADEETLYVAIAPSPDHSPMGQIVSLSRDETGAWDRDRLAEVHLTGWPIGALATDVCGNLYFANRTTGRILRIRAVDGRIENVGGLDLGPDLTALRFGAGTGPYLRDTLYAAVGGQLFGIAVGIEGNALF